MIMMYRILRLFVCTQFELVECVYVYNVCYFVCLTSKLIAAFVNVVQTELNSIGITMS